MATKNAKPAPKKNNNSEKTLILFVREPESRCRRCGANCACSEEEIDAGGPA